jgi:uncharacterized protein YgiM (DUF1202 family)
MQRLICLAGLAILGLSYPAFAQNSPADQVISVPEVEVRSGPSMQAYATSKLHSGDRVRVVDTKNQGWLGIKPPPGSYNWINQRYVNRDSNNFSAVVIVPSADVLIGSQLVKEMPNKRGATLPQGTIVTLLKDQRSDGGFDIMPATGPDGVYYAIVPPTIDEELRWIPASAVQQQPPAQSFTSPINAGASSPATSDAALLVRAERSAAGNNIADALACYSELARQTSDPSVRAWASDRYQALQYRPASSANVQSNYSQNGSGRNNPAIAANTTSNVNVRPDYRHTGPGTLSRSYLTVAGGKMWALEPDDPRQQHRTYVKAGPSINLEDYVNRHVDVTGTLTYDGELRDYYLTATKVEMLSR